MRLMERIQAKLELRRLEKRYTRRENRTGFTSDAVYVDGEYLSPTQLWNYRHNSDTSTHTSSTANSYSSNCSTSGAKHYRDTTTGIGLVNAHATTSSVGGSMRRACSSMSLKSGHGRSFDDMRAAYGYGGGMRSGSGSAGSSAANSPTTPLPSPSPRRRAGGLSWVPEEGEKHAASADAEAERRRRRELDDGCVFGYDGSAGGRTARSRVWRGSTIW